MTNIEILFLGYMGVVMLMLGILHTRLRNLEVILADMLQEAYAEEEKTK